MKILDKFKGHYQETVFDRAKRNQQLEISKKSKPTDENAPMVDLNEAALYFSRHQSSEKINGIEEAYKLLNEMTRYLENTTQAGNAVELTKGMHFDTKKITAILVS